MLDCYAPPTDYHICLGFVGWAVGWDPQELGYVSFISGGHFRWLQPFYNVHPTPSYRFNDSKTRKSNKKSSEMGGGGKSDHSLNRNQKFPMGFGPFVFLGLNSLSWWESILLQGHLSCLRFKISWRNAGKKGLKHIVLKKCCSKSPHFFCCLGISSILPEKKIDASQHGWIYEYRSKVNMVLMSSNGRSTIK